MANKPDTEARALLDALCEWLTKDVGYMPDYVNRLRDKFDAIVGSRGRPLIPVAPPAHTADENREGKRR